MMNSLYTTLAKTPAFRLSARSLSSNYWTTKLPPDPAVEARDATAMAEKHAAEDINGAKNWRRPSEIPFQSKVVNWVNLIGTIRMPVQFVTTADGKSWAGTVVSQDTNSSSLRLFWIPIIFEGDLAHTAAAHLKVLDTVHVAGQLSPDPMPINLTNGRVDVQVKVQDIHFVRGLHNMKKNIRR